MPEQIGPRDSGECLLPHLNAAYNLARWLTRDDHDAWDVVQDAYLRALRFLEGFRGGDSRAWLLKIVRNTAYTWLERNRTRRPTIAFDEEVHSDKGDGADPSALLLQKADRRLIQCALAELPAKLREMLVLRELEGLSYKEIAEAADIPIGTVMSSLARGRALLRRSVRNLIESDRLPNGTPRTPRLREQGGRAARSRAGVQGSALRDLIPAVQDPPISAHCSGAGNR